MYIAISLLLLPVSDGGISRALHSVGQLNADLIRIDDGDDSYLLSGFVALLLCSENSHLIRSAPAAPTPPTRPPPPPMADCIPITTRFVIPQLSRVITGRYLTAGMPVYAAFNQHQLFTNDSSSRLMKFDVGIFLFRLKSDIINGPEL